MPCARGNVAKMAKAAREISSLEALALDSFAVKELKTSYYDEESSFSSSYTYYDTLPSLTTTQWSGMVC